MFGYIRPPLGKLPQEEQERFRQVYCGLCNTLGTRYGLTARFILNYDFTFLAVLLSDGKEDGEHCIRCLVHPLKKRRCRPVDPALELAADESVILAYWQLRDGVADHGFWKGLKYRLLSGLLHGAYQKAANVRPAFDASTREHLKKLSALESERSASMDQAADTFAALLSSAAWEVDDPVRRRVLEQMLYHLGRWVYLVDAADDLKKDAASGDYNPVALRFGLRDGTWTPESRHEFAQTLDHSIRMVATAFELWDFGCWRTILESTIYTSLFYVGGAVLDGTFQAGIRNRNRNKSRDGEEAHE